LSGLQLEFKEPYPVYRGLRVPVWEGGKPVSVRRVTDEDRKAFTEAMGKLRELLERVAKMASEIGAGEEELLGLLADAIVVFLRAPLIQELAPVAPTPLKAYALMLVSPKLRRGLWSQDPCEFAKNLASLTSEELGFAKVLFDPETAELVYRLWIAFPADTRPGYNTSSLLAHVLMTSAIAWALALSEGPRGAGEEALIRLSALLHDLGKAVDPEAHVKASEALARWLLQGLVSESALEKLVEAIREHHRYVPLLSEADRLASSADRLRHLVDTIIGGKIESVERLLGGSRDRWDFWRRIHERRGELAIEDPLKEFTEEFLKGIEKLKPKELIEKFLKDVEKPEQGSPLSLVLFDVESIQGFVGRSQEVRVVAAASHLIELAVHVHFLEFLRSNGVRVPPEAVIYAGGGNILMLLPSRMAGDVKRLASEYSERARVSRIAVASAPFVDFYPIASLQLFEGMYREKHSIELADSLEPEGPGVRSLCRMCYSDWATNTLLTPEGEVSVCDTCRMLYETGSESHFRPKWSARARVAGSEFSPEEAFEARWDDVSAYVMEIVAGHEPEELREGRPERLRDYAVVKFDGNAIGAFMLEAVSFTDAIEKSFRIDVALKKAYFKALEALYQGVKKAAGEDCAKREIARAYLGTIYMGGDDGFLLAPSWAAIPLAHFIAEEFSRQLGLERGLRVAVAAGPAKMSLWALLDCANQLLEEVGSALRRIDPTAREDVLGAVAFDLFESGSPSGATAVERMKRISWKASDEPRQRDERVDSLQPYLIRRRDLEGNGVPEFWSTLAPLVVRVDVSGWKHDVSFNMHVELFRKAYLCSRAKEAGEETDEQRELRNLRSVMLSSWSAVSPSAYWREKLLLFLLRQSARREEEEQPPSEREEEVLEAYRRLARFVSQSLGREGIGPVPIADAFTLLKFLKGGAW